MPTTTSEREKPRAFGRLLSVLLLGMVVCTLVPSSPAVTASTGGSTWAKALGKTWYLWQSKGESLPVGHAPEWPVGQAFLMMSPATKGQIIQSLVEEHDRRINVSATELRQQCVDIASADARLHNEQRRAAADPPRVTPEPLPPTLPPPQSAPPSPPNYESKPFAQQDTPDVPSPWQPAPAKPGLPQPPMPEPAKPGLPSPPMPQPAEPPTLSGGPGTESPPVPPEQKPTVPAPEPTAPSADRAA